MKLEIREDNVVLEGYINVTNRESKVLTDEKGKFIEVINPKVFERAIRNNPKILLLRDHDFKLNLGDTTNNLKLREDAIGLHYEATVSDPDTMALAKASKLSGCSFGFNKPEYSKIRMENGIEKRYINSLDLFEVSILSDTKNPAYTGCSVYTREEDNVEMQVHIRELQEVNEVEEVDITRETMELELLKLKA